MLAGTVLYILLLIYAGLSLFIKSGLYVYMVVCVVYAYNLTFRVLILCSNASKPGRIKSKSESKKEYLCS